MQLSRVTACFLTRERTRESHAEIRVIAFGERPDSRSPCGSCSPAGVSGAEVTDAALLQRPPHGGALKQHTIVSMAIRRKAPFGGNLRRTDAIIKQLLVVFRLGGGVGRPLRHAPATVASHRGVTARADCRGIPYGGRILPQSAKTVSSRRLPAKVIALNSLG